MSELIKDLPWDSEFFGLRIGRVDILFEDDWRRLEGILSKSVPFDLLYVFDEEKNGTIINNAKLVDTKVLYRKKVCSSHRSQSPNVRIYEGSSPDDDLYSLALTSGQYSRYKLDSNFPNGCYERLYRKWIENSVNGQMADQVLYYSDALRKTGMLTIQIKGESASIGLIAVDSECQGQGIGTELVSVAEELLLNCGVKTIEVATQKDNLLGCRFYEKRGFLKISETRIYHLWL